MQAVLIKVEFKAPSYRAGNFSPEGRRFPVIAQNTIDGYEIRLCESDADVGYVNELVSAGVEGVNLLDGDEEIDEALDTYIYTGDNGRDRYQIWSDALAAEYIRQQGVDLAGLGGMDNPEVAAQILYARGVPGIAKHTPQRIRAADVRERRERIERQRAQANEVKARIKARRAERAKESTNDPSTDP